MAKKKSAEVAETIEFGDGPEEEAASEIVLQEESALPQRSAERDRANQAAARNAVDRMRSDPNFHARVVPPTLREPNSEEAASLVRKAFLIAEVPPGQVQIKQGKVFREGQYDVPTLRRQGFKIIEVEPETMRPVAPVSST